MRSQRAWLHHIQYIACRPEKGFTVCILLPAVYSSHATGEYIDDTEDLINIQLDYSRNKLIRFEIILTTGTFAIAIFSAVAGMLGENLALPEIITEVRLLASMWGALGAVASGEVIVCMEQRLLLSPV